MASLASVFQQGKHEVSTIELKSDHPNDPSSPPKPLLVFHPNDAGEYPILLFLHGYLLRNSFYSQLLSHIASHAFVVVAPQLYTFALSDCMEEIKNAATIVDWISTSLQGKLPANVHLDLNRVGLSGHSRGGKVSFALLLGLGNVQTKLKFSALLGVDPVDGKSESVQTDPPVLRHEPGCLDPKMAVLVIGSDLGSVGRCRGLPSCAPNGVNHVNFSAECVPPLCYAVATNYGHVDMLDDKTTGIIGRASYCLCANGDRREPMRKFMGGMMVAFLQAYLLNDSKNLEKIVQEPHTQPIDYTIEYKV